MKLAEDKSYVDFNDVEVNLENLLNLVFLCYEVLVDSFAIADTFEMFKSKNINFKHLFRYNQQIALISAISTVTVETMELLEFAQKNQKAVTV